MKVIFLDIDGVLNSDQDWLASKKTMTVSDTGYMGISNVRLRLLKQIVDITDAKIVLVSSWKRHYITYKNQVKDYLEANVDIPLSHYCERDKFGYYLHKKFHKNGLDVFDTTLSYEAGSSRRGSGILNYLDKHQEIDSWVVLDDEFFIDYYDTIRQHLVFTDEQFGLTEQDVQAAIKILNNEKEQL